MKDYFNSLDTSMDLALSSTLMSESIPESGMPTPIPGSETMPVPSSPEAMIVGIAVELVETSIRCFTEYQMCKQHEETERRRIAAELKATVVKIEATKELYKDVIEKSFKEREGLYDGAMQAVDRALELNDLDMLKTAYNFILNIYEKSPNININFG